MYNEALSPAVPGWDIEMVDVPIPGFWKYWTNKVASVKSEWHTIMSRYPEAACVVQQV
jgi:hypothetical protein